MDVSIDMGRFPYIHLKDRYCCCKGVLETARSSSVGSVSRNAFNISKL
jgi:hypothetical protein